MPAHPALDRASGLALCAAAGTMTDEQGGVRASILGLGLFEVTASLTTKAVPQTEA